MNKAKEISALWKQIKPQIGELARLCHEVESHAEVTADAYQRGYEAGLNDAWEAARKIWEYDTTTLKAIFGEGVMRMDWFMKFTASECIEKIRQYEQEKEEFHVGDEFEIETGQKFVIIKMDGNKIDRYIDENGTSYCLYYKYNTMRKTGRHFPEIAEVLQKMRENNDNK